MLSQAFDPRYRPDRAAGHRFFGRPFRADRRNRRRQIHPARRAVAGARRARRRLAGPPRRGAGPGDRRLRRAAQPSGARACSPKTRIDDDGDIILRRVQTADGRTRVFVNDQPSSVTLMRDIGRALVEIHGQHDERALVDARAHRDLLDAFGGHVGEARDTARGLAAAGAMPSRSCARHRAKVEAAAREADYLRASVAELSQARPAARRGNRSCRTCAPR